MSGCYGNHLEDRAMQSELNRYLNKTTKDDSREKRIEELAKDKFMALPDLYRSTDGIKRYTNIDDASGSIKQEEWVSIARAIRDSDNKLAGDILAASLMRVCVRNAENEIDETDWED